ncbi:carbohydrate kinase family protein [Methylocaldum szegediense]|uniref:Ribokinase n=1 Tax=Methylocaldum szegediense TaxID=73780 RepID=A0ABM9HYN4_9GAMM|nr:carbohydrate kinase family protein [Methylocaldum szegediense]CAI8774482.1 Ribokinase [Methylocaldum szegediense]
MIHRFICVGNLNVDLTFPITRLPAEHEKLRCQGMTLHYGGSAANTAYWLARLGQPVQMLGCVGDDPFGALAVAELAEAGVDTSLIQRTRRSLTGMAVIFASPGSKRMVTSGGANTYFNPAEVDSGIFGPGTHLHVATSLNEIALPLVRLARQRGASVSCGLDEGPSTDMMPWLDWVFMNHTELRRWSGADDPREARRRLPPSTQLVVTRGASGAMALGPFGEYTCPAFPAIVVDRTGGGDAFDAGFLYGLARAAGPETCLRFGLLLAARVIAHEGSRPQSVDAAETLAPVMRGI